MTIGKKLYYGFGAVLLLVLIVFAVNLSAIFREHSVRDQAKSTTNSIETISSVRYQMMEARLDLRNFLLSGDPRVEAQMNKQETDLMDYLAKADATTDSDILRNALTDVAATEEE